MSAFSARASAQWAKTESTAIATVEDDRAEKSQPKAMVTAFAGRSRCEGDRGSHPAGEPRVRSNVPPAEMKPRYGTLMAAPSGFPGLDRPGSTDKEAATRVGTA